MWHRGYNDDVDNSLDTNNRPVGGQRCYRLLSQTVQTVLGAIIGTLLGLCLLCGVSAVLLYRKRKDAAFRETLSKALAANVGGAVTVVIAPPPAQAELPAGPIPIRRRSTDWHVSYTYYPKRKSGFLSIPDGILSGSARLHNFRVKDEVRGDIVAARRRMLLDQLDPGKGWSAFELGRVGQRHYAGTAPSARDFSNVNLEELKELEAILVRVVDYQA
ncbi:hypothetical protein T492DRAFT_886325, partial [Pavlovales sp. CCMP2436]